MTTLIKGGGSEGATRRCDATCHGAKGGQCQCICGGMNHGVGHDQAAENTRQHVETAVRLYGSPALQEALIQTPLEATT